MAERKLTTKIELSGEKEYSNALKSINSEARLTSSELNKLKSDYAGQLNSLEYLESKQKSLSESYELAAKKVKTMRDAMENAQNIQSEYGQKIDLTKRTIAELSEEMSKLDTSTDTGAAAYQEMQQQLEELNAELAYSENVYAAAGDSVQNWTTSLNNASVSKRRLGQQLEATNKYLEEARASTDNCATSIDGFGKKTSDAATDAGALGQEVEAAGDAMESTSASTVALGNIMADALEKAAEKALELGAELTSAGVEYQQSQGKLAAATGATGDALERLNTVAKNVFARGLGDSLSSAYDGVIEVKTATGLMDEELQKAVESGYALQDTFGFELQESARTADALIKNFGITAEKAYNIIAIGAQNGANKNGDLLDVLNEYSAQYAALGLDADAFIQSLISGAEAGAFSIDKVGDAVKEFNIRAKDGSDTSREAFELLGMSASSMTARFAAGGESAKTALFEVVAALGAMDDPVQKNAAAVALFGTQYEDLEENLLPILASMEDASVSTYDAMGQINEVRYNDLQTQWDTIKRKIVSSTLPQLQTALDKLGDTMEDPRMTDAAEDLGESLGDLAESGGNLAETVLPVLVKGLDLLVDGVDLAVDNLPELVSALVAYKGAALAAKIQQEELNLALNLNPYAAASAMVALLGAAIADAVVETYSMDSAAKSLNDSLASTQEQAAKELDALEANTTAALNLIPQIDALAATENKSAAEKERLKSLISSLNELVPGLGASYDELTDSINMSTDEMREFILQSAKLQAVENLQGELSELYVDQAKALTNLNEKKTEAADADKEYWEAVSLLDKQLASGCITMMQYSLEVGKLNLEYTKTTRAADDAEDAYNAISSAVSDAEKQVLDYADCVGSSTEATEEDTEALEDNTEALEAAAEAAEEYAQTVNDMQTVLNDAGIAADGLAEKLVEQGVTASDAESKIDSYKDTTLDAFTKIEEQQDISVQSMIETLTHNAEVTQTWAENLGILYAQAGDASTKSFLAYMEGLGPSYAPILAELTADTSGELLTNLVSAWSSGSDAAVQAALVAMGVLPEEAASIAASAAQTSGEQFSADVSAYAAAGEEAQAAYIDALSEITPEASSVLKELNAEIDKRLAALTKSMQADGKNAGSGFMSKLQQGINSGKSGVVSTTTAVGNAAGNAIKGISWYSLGYNMPAGIAKGFNAGSYLLTNAAVTAVENALVAAKKKAGVASPAIEWDEDLGVFLPRGAAQGVERGTPDLLEAVGYSMEAALESARQTLSDAQGISLYDFVPSLDSLSSADVYNYSSTYHYGAAGASGGAVAANSGALEKYLPQILDELRSTGGVTPAMIARAMSPYMDTELGTILRRKERGS